MFQWQRRSLLCRGGPVRFHTTRPVSLARLAQWLSFDLRRGDPGSIPGWCNFFVLIIFFDFFFDVPVII